MFDLIGPAWLFVYLDQMVCDRLPNLLFMNWIYDNLFVL